MKFFVNKGNQDNQGKQANAENHKRFLVSTCARGLVENDGKMPETLMNKHETYQKHENHENRDAKNGGTNMEQIQ